MFDKIESQITQNETLLKEAQYKEQDEFNKINLSIAHKFERAATKDDLKECYKNFDNYASYSHIQEMKDKVLPVVKKFTTEMT